MEVYCFIPTQSILETMLYFRSMPLALCCEFWKEGLSDCLSLPPLSQKSCPYKNRLNTFTPSSPILYLLGGCSAGSRYLLQKANTAPRLHSGNMHLKIRHSGEHKVGWAQYLLLLPVQQLGSDHSLH